MLQFHDIVLLLLKKIICFSHWYPAVLTPPIVQGGIRMIQPNFPPPDWNFPLSSYYPMGNFQSFMPRSFHTYLNQQVHRPYIPLPSNVASQAQIDLPMSSPTLQDPTELQLRGSQSPKEANRQSSKSVASIQVKWHEPLFIQKQLGEWVRIYFSDRMH